jgi:hypothetical protein
VTTDSYPVVGSAGLNEAQWQTMWQPDDGIVGDYTGLSCNLSRINTGNIARIATGKVRVGGYILDITADHDLTIPTTGATYHIWAGYDPVLNTGGGATAGPCSLGFSAGAPSTTGGKAYVLLWTITRTASQNLADTTYVDYRRWVGPSIQGPTLPAGEKATPRVLTTGFGPFPVGTSYYETTTGNLYRFTYAAGALKWASITDTTEVDFPFNSPLQAVDASPMMRKVAGEVMLRGTLKRTSGANLSSGSEVLLGTFPTGWQPSSIRRFICYGNGIGTSQVIAPVKVLGTTAGDAAGQVWMYDPPNTVVWVDLSAIQFRGA